MKLEVTVGEYTWLFSSSVTEQDVVTLLKGMAFLIDSLGLDEATRRVGKAVSLRRRHIETSSDK